METEKMGMREFRENLAGYRQSRKAAGHHRHGGTLPRQSRKEIECQVRIWGWMPNFDRAVLRQRVRRILESHADGISFFIPETAYAEADGTWPHLWLGAAANLKRHCALLRSLAAVGAVMSCELYTEFETEAGNRLPSRDPDDWPILAAAFALSCPI
jgi:hypothetical protein